jgi:predicted AAA+ superfamily ATPase
VETIELLPLSQAEIEGRVPPDFLTRALAGNFPVQRETGFTTDLIERIVLGGYPEALSRPSGRRRQAWLMAYAQALTQRDVSEIATISKTAELTRLLGHAAISSGQTVNLTALAKPLGVDIKTVDRWLSLLEQMFIVRRVSAWHRNDLKRLVKTPKLHFLDSGLLSALRRVDADKLRADRKKLGSLLEGFVFSELSKMASQGSEPVSLGHYRDRDQVEVDFVVECAGRVAGIEVKAGSTVSPADFRGLKRLQNAVGDTFACGIVLHDGERIQRTGHKRFAMPVNQLWA